MYIRIAFWVVQWAPTVLIALGCVSWLVKVATALIANRPGHVGSDLHKSLSTWGRSTLLTVLPFIMLLSISQKWPTADALWIDATMYILAFVAGIAYNIVDTVSYVVELS